MVQIRLYDLPKPNFHQADEKMFGAWIQERFKRFLSYEEMLTHKYLLILRIWDE